MSSGTITDDLRAEFRAFLGADPGLIADPYALYRRMRNVAPVFEYEPGTFVLTRHRDVKAVLRNAKAFPSPAERLVPYDNRFSLLSDEDMALYREIAAFERLFVSRKSGEEHRRQRSAMHRGLTPRRIAEMRASVESIVSGQIDALAERGRKVDVMQIAYRVPLLVIMDMLGAPHEDADRIKAWGDAVLEAIMFIPLEPERVRDGHAQLADYRAYATELVERNRRRGDDNHTLVGLLLDAEQGDAISLDELVATFLHFLFAGHETTTNLIGNGLYALLSDRTQWEAICADPARIPNAVEEVLRFESPVQQSARTVAEDTEIAGVAVPSGSGIVVSEGAANRDPAVFDDPDRFDVTRTGIDHLSFGHGPHFCLGASLARQEAHVVLETLVRRFPDLTLDADPAQLEWVARPRLRGLHALPVDLGAERS